MKHQQCINHLRLKYLSILQILESNASLYPEKPGLIFPGAVEKKFNFQEIHVHVMRISQHLHRIGIKSGDRVAIIFPNSPEFIFIYLSCLVSGITVVPINPELSSIEIEFIVENSGSVCIFYDLFYESKLKLLKVKSFGVSSFLDLAVRVEQAEYQKSPVDLDLDAVIIYTSGTTGKPKGVVLSHKNILSDGQAISEWFKFDSDVRALCILPMFHNNGQITTLFAPLIAGGTSIIVNGKSSILSFWALTKKYQITFSSVMASILSILLGMKFENESESLKAILCGGQVLLPAVQDNFEKRFKVPIFEGFGLTETTSFACINDYPKSFRVAGSIGKPLPINEIEIFDDNGDVLEPLKEGQICIRGYNVCKEYLGLADRNAISFADGWFRTGDYGYKNIDGYLFFKGRKDFLIIKGGENIYPAELENVICQNENVQECAVIGVPDQNLGQEICVFIKYKPGQNQSSEDIKRFCRTKIAQYKQPKKVIDLELQTSFLEIPKGPTKKILYRDLINYFNDNHEEIND